jgi:hypothetical protein
LDTTAEILWNGAADTKLYSDDEIYEHQIIQVYFVDKFGFVVGTVPEPRCFREFCKCVVNHFVVPIQGSIGFVLHENLLLGL